jgi:hypothetical protein
MLGMHGRPRSRLRDSRVVSAAADDRVTISMVAMKRTAPLKLVALAAFVQLVAGTLSLTASPQATGGVSPVARSTVGALDAEDWTDSARSVALWHTRERLQLDVEAMQTFRPGYPFWQHVFTIPDGSIAFGSALNGRLLAVFPTRGEWARDVTWHDEVFADALVGRRLPVRLADRRDQVAQLLEETAGPVLHNPTRGLFLLPNARRYGSFLGEWSAIYDRFAVPADLGLAQVIVESGFSGTTRSEARAIGFCQWLDRNWKRLQRLAPNVIEGYNQTTQAPYCAAYLTILAAKYRTFIPALSEHHAGGTNVGRTVINGWRLGGTDNRERYFLGAEFARDLRNLRLRAFSDVYGTYGPRSFRYAEMVFGNTFNVTRLRESIPQTRIYAMRATRPIPLGEITRRTGLSADEVKRFNPALVRQVPSRANLYLPMYVQEFGPDVSFWHRPANSDYLMTLNDFVRLEAAVEEWDDPSFEPVLREFQRRFGATNTEEGAIMATMLAYVMEDAYTSRRSAILSEFRTSEQFVRLFERGASQRDTHRGSHASVRCSTPTDPTEVPSDLLSDQVSRSC